MFPFKVIGFCVNSCKSKMAASVGHSYSLTWDTMGKYMIIKEIQDGHHKYDKVLVEQVLRNLLSNIDA